MKATGGPSNGAGEGSRGAFVLVAFPFFVFVFLRHVDVGDGCNPTAPFTHMRECDAWGREEPGFLVVGLVLLAVVVVSTRLKQLKRF